QPLFHFENHGPTRGRPGWRVQMSSPRSTIQTTRGSSRPAPGFQSYTVASPAGAEEAEDSAGSPAALEALRAEGKEKSAASEESGEGASGFAGAEATVPDPDRRGRGSAAVPASWRAPGRSSTMAATAAAAAVPAARRRRVRRIRFSVSIRATP